MLAIGRPDGTVQLWNVTARPSKLTTIDGTPATADPIAFSRDALTLAAVGAEQTTRLWDVRDLSQPSLLAVLTDAANPVAFTPDGNTLVVIDGEGAIELRTTDEQRSASQSARSAAQPSPQPSGRSTFPTCHTRSRVPVWSRNPEHRRTSSWPASRKVSAEGSAVGSSMASWATVGATARSLAPTRRPGNFVTIEMVTNRN
jgi:hypothetical protein